MEATIGYRALSLNISSQEAEAEDLKLGDQSGLQNEILSQKKKKSKEKKKNILYN